VSSFFINFVKNEFVYFLLTLVPDLLVTNWVQDVSNDMHGAQEYSTGNAATYSGCGRV